MTSLSSHPSTAIFSNKPSQPPSRPTKCSINRQTRTSQGLHRTRLTRYMTKPGTSSTSIGRLIRNLWRSIGPRPPRACCERCTGTAMGCSTPGRKRRARGRFWPKRKPFWGKYCSSRLKRGRREEVSIVWMVVAVVKSTLPPQVTLNSKRLSRLWSNWSRIWSWSEEGTRNCQPLTTNTQMICTRVRQRPRTDSLSSRSLNIPVCHTGGPCPSQEGQVVPESAVVQRRTGGIRRSSITSARERRLWPGGARRNNRPPSCQERKTTRRTASSHLKRI